MSNAQPETSDDDLVLETKATASLVEQIVDVTLADRRLTEKVSALGLEKLRKTLLRETLVKPDEVVAAVNHKDDASETA